MKRFYFEYCQTINNRKKSVLNSSELFIGKKESENNAIHSYDTLKPRRNSFQRPMSSIQLKRNSVTQIDNSLTQLNSFVLIQPYKTVNLQSNLITRNCSRTSKRKIFNTEKQQQFRQFPNKSLIISNFLVE